MAGKSARRSRWEDDREWEKERRHDPQPRLSRLQQDIMHWLRTELRRRQRTGEDLTIPYPDLVRALGADKASVTDNVRRLLKKGLVTVTLPRGGWVRGVTLTEQGAEQAKGLSKEARQHRERPY